LQKRREACKGECSWGSDINSQYLKAFWQVVVLRILHYQVEMCEMFWKDIVQLVGALIAAMWSENRTRKKRGKRRGITRDLRKMSEIRRKLLKFVVLIVRIGVVAASDRVSKLRKHLRAL
jgi:hypothetical protein